MNQQNHSYILQIDLLKGLAIISVIASHIVVYQTITNPQIVPIFSEQIANNSIAAQTNINSVNLLDTIYRTLTHWVTYAGLTTEQVIPLFIIIMSFNLRMSFHRRGYSELKQFYSRYEIKKKFRRYFIPYILIFLISLILGLGLLLLRNQEILFFNFRLLFGYLPINGPGAYFIPLILQMVLLFPLLYSFYKYNRNLCLIIGFFIAFLCEIINGFGTNRIWYYDSLLRFFPHIILGIWIFDLYLASQLKNKYFIVFGIFSGLYLIFINQFENGVIGSIHFYRYTASQNLFSCGWCALIFIIGLRYFPKVKNIATKPLAIIGKASYHIFLTQIVYFGLVGGFRLTYHSLFDLLSINNIAIIGIALSINILLGVGFYVLDKHNFYLSKTI